MNARPLAPPAAMALALMCLASASCGERVTEPEKAATPGAPTPAFAIASNTWLTRTDMPSTDRLLFATAVVPNATGQSILYAIGGLSAGGTVSRVQAYNVATNTWTWKAPLPAPLYWTNGAGVIGGKIYVTGGLHGLPSKALYRYDPATNTWTRKHDLPITSFGGITGIIDDKLYVTTTCSVMESCEYGAASPYTGHPDRWLFRYDPLTDAWTELAIPPRIYLSGVGGMIGKKFYIGVGESNVVDIYDPVTNTWTEKRANGSVPFDAAGATLGAKLYAMGGLRRDAQGTYQEIRTSSVYDPGTNSWATIAPLPTARSRMGAGRVLLNGRARIEVVGGRRPGNNLAYVP
jgi:N-acetylneuraminic acid mutarotase